MTTQHLHAQVTLARRSAAAVLMLVIVACAPSDGVPLPGDGEAAVQVVVTGPGRIFQGAFTCSGDCAWEGGGTAVSFEAVPDPGYVFVAWGGDCPATLDDACTRTFEEGDSIIATFARHALRLHLVGDGEGAFRIAGGAIDARCDADCGLPLDVSLQLAITHDREGTTGTDVGAWTGACAGAEMTNYCLVTATGATDVGKTWRHAPVASVDGYGATRDVTLDVDATAGVLANDEDSLTDTLTASLVSDVVHGTLALSADGSFSYLSDAWFVGQDMFVYRVRDAFGNEDAAEAIIDVMPGEFDHAPVANDDAYATTRNASLTVGAPDGVLANDTDPDGDTLTATLEDDADVGTLTLRIDGSFDYHPGGYVGPATFTYRASDGVNDSDIATVMIVSSNQAPSATADAYRAREDRTLRVHADKGVLVNDSDPDGDPLIAILDLDVENGALELEPDGSFTYKPDRGFDGEDAFTYRASDGLDTSVATIVAITVEDD